MLDRRPAPSMMAFRFGVVVNVVLWLAIFELIRR